jgi:carbohydrate-selective porin OprB
MFEAFYNIQVTPQLNVQPDVQFINQPQHQDFLHNNAQSPGSSQHPSRHN